MLRNAAMKATGRRGATACIALLSAAFLAGAVWVAFEQTRDPCDGCIIDLVVAGQFPEYEIRIWMLGTIFNAAIYLGSGAWLAYWALRGHTVFVAGFLVLNATGVIVGLYGLAGAHATQRPGRSPPMAVKLGTGALVASNMGIWAILNIAICIQVLKRIQATNTPVASRASRILTGCLYLYAGEICLGLALGALWTGLPWWIKAMVTWLLFGQIFCTLCISLWGFSEGYKLARAASACTVGREAEEAAMAVRAARNQLVGVVVLASTVVCKVLAAFSILARQHPGVLWPLTAWLPASPWWEPASNLWDAIGTAFGSLFFAGAGTGALRAAWGNQQAKADLVAKRAAAVREWQPNEDPRWNERVGELADRGFTLQALLGFYRGLGRDVMPHWSPQRHTTADVVRHAIIPQSAEAKTALAVVLMNGVPTRPDSMVTHNWSNRFVHLVAAIISDALGEDEYCRVAYLLMKQGGVEVLESWLEKSGALQRSYWVCAFSVNQHITICGGNPHEALDSVTGELYPLCRCDRPKMWNHTEPLSKDGRSIGCEVNKFDDMMKMLSASNPRFTQIVAVDEKFELFGRAWCVAELAAAHEMGMGQKLKFNTAEGLTEREDDLRQLRIENMQASRPEDKEEILAKIADRDAFNRALQKMLFEDLLPDWQNLDAMDQMHRLAKIARWQTVCHQRASVGIWLSSAKLQVLPSMVGVSEVANVQLVPQSPPKEYDDGASGAAPGARTAPPAGAASASAAETNSEQGEVPFLAAGTPLEERGPRDAAARAAGGASEDGEDGGEGAEAVGPLATVAIGAAPRPGGARPVKRTSTSASSKQGPTPSGGSKGKPKKKSKAKSKDNLGS